MMDCLFVNNEGYTIFSNLNTNLQKIVIPVANYIK